MSQFWLLGWPSWKNESYRMVVCHLPQLHPQKITHPQKGCHFKRKGGCLPVPLFFRGRPSNLGPSYPPNWWVTFRSLFGTFLWVESRGYKICSFPKSSSHLECSGTSLQPVEACFIDLGVERLKAVLLPPPPVWAKIKPNYRHSWETDDPPGDRSDTIASWLFDRDAYTGLL